MRDTNTIAIARFYPANVYLFKVSKRNTWESCEICLKSTIKLPERLHCCHSGVVIVNFEHSFDTFFWCFYCWIWTSKCLLGNAFIVTLKKNHALLKKPLLLIWKYAIYLLGTCWLHRPLFLSTLWRHQRLHNLAYKRKSGKITKITICLQRQSFGKSTFQRTTTGNISISKQILKKINSVKRPFANKNSTKVRMRRKLHDYNQNYKQETNNLNVSKVHLKNTRHISALNYKQLSSWTGICPLGKQNIVEKSRNAFLANMYLLKVTIETLEKNLK